MFSFRHFVKDGLCKAVGAMADYQIVLNAAGWFEKNVLLESDLAHIEAAIAAHNEMKKAQALENEPPELEQ